MQRLFVAIVLLVSAFWLPWWFTIFLACVATFIFENYIELLAMGLLIDSLYNIQIEALDLFPFKISILAVILFCFIAFLKKRLRFYDATL